MWFLYEMWEFRTKNPTTAQKKSLHLGSERNRNRRSRNSCFPYTFDNGGIVINIVESPIGETETPMIHSERSMLREHKIWFKNITNLTVLKYCHNYIIAITQGKACFWYFMHSLLQKIKEKKKT